LSRKRDINAAKTFLRKAMKGQRIPTKITLDAYSASHRSVADLKQSGELPKRVKQRLGPMLGLKSFRNAAVMISGIEWAEKIKKGQFKLGKFRGCSMAVIWQAVLAA
jgi:transposase-like protein